MASSPITSWQIDGETMETVTDFIFLGSKITADGDCSPEIKRCLLLGRKAMKNLDSILKSRDITLPTKVCLVKAMVFPVVMCGCESWTTKISECWRIYALEPCCWRDSWTESLGLQGDPTSPSERKSILNIHWKDWFWSWNFNTLATWCEELTHWKKILMLEKIAGRSRGGRQRTDDWMGSLTQWAWVWAGSGSWWWTGKPGMLQKGVTNHQIWLSDWTEPSHKSKQKYILKCPLCTWENWAKITNIVKKIIVFKKIIGALRPK